MKRALLVGAVLAVAATAGAQLVRTTAGWNGQVRLEVTGTNFPTLPMPLATIRLQAVHATAETDHRRASAAATLEMNLTPREAARLGQALLDWSQAPDSRTILWKRVAGPPIQ